MGSKAATNTDSRRGEESPSIMTVEISGTRSVPKLQFIYFLITISGIVATLCGLYLSHLAIDVFQKSFYNAPVYELEALGTRLMQDSAADTLGELLTAAPSAPKVEAHAKKFSGVRRNVEQLLPKYFTPAQQQEVKQQLLRMQAAMDALSHMATTSASGANLAEVNRLFVDVRASADKIDALVASMRAASIEGQKAAVAGLKNYEYVVGGLLVLVMCAGAYYGLFIGKVMKRKFEEIEKANADLEESHEQALAFSREIQSVNHDMGSLNKQLHENIAKLREAQDEALRKGKMAQLGNLTATVAHELRNPLSVVRTSAFLLGRRLKDKGLGVEPQLQRINSGIVRCDNIITQLLDFSRSRAVKTEPVLFDEWLEKLVQTEAQKLPEALGIECQFGLGTMQVSIEPGRFERAIINLLNNASEALVGKGDDPKSQHCSDPLISVATQVTTRGIEISVSDNGPGISAENLVKIREPLFTTKNFGTGLGIPAVEQILEQHGGGLDITSEEGKGARFTLWLPAAQAQESAA